MVTHASSRPQHNDSISIPSRKGLAPSKSIVSGHTGQKITRTITVRQPAHALYAFCRDLENLDRVIQHLVIITARSAIESHWSVSAPPGEKSIEWDALIINDERDKLIAWRSSDASEIAHAGTVRFEPAPGDEGTEVTVTLDYIPPAEETGALRVQVSNEEVGEQVAQALRRFKALMEAGEIPTIEGQPDGGPQRMKNR